MSSIIEVGKSSIRKANASMVESRIGKVNPATGRNWFEVPSAEYQSWENKKADRALADRQSIGNQDINQERRVLTELQPLANNEANRAYGMKLDNDNRALGMELATKLPYWSADESIKSMRQAGVNNTSLASSIGQAYTNSLTRLNPVSMSL